MNQCQICEKKFNREEPGNNDLSHECFAFYKSVVDLSFFQQKLLSKLESKYPTQYAKLKSLISKEEVSIKEQVEPNLKKIEQALKKFFQSKGKMIEGYSEEYWLSSSCEDCQEELKKQVKSAVDDIERKRLELKFKATGEEMQKNLCTNS